MHHEQNNPGSPDQLSEKVQKLEEALGFAEHDRDQLHQHLLALTQDLRALQRRLATLEQRLDSKDSPQSETQDGNELPSDQQ